MNTNSVVQGSRTCNLVEARLQSPKLCAAVLILAMLTAVFSLSIGVSSSTGSVVIANTGKISAGAIAQSGSAADIQAAVNVVASAGGGNVYVPAGTYYWNNQTVTIPGGVNVFGASYAGCDGHTNNWTSYNATTILNNTAATPSNTMFYVNGLDGKASRISGIEFVTTGPVNTTMESIGTGPAVWLYEIINAHVDHCTFINFYSAAVLLSNTNTGTASAVLDHNVVNDPYKLSSSGWSWGYGFYAQGEYPNWDSNITHFLGQFNVVGAPVLYVEDNHFSLCRHATDCIQEGWDVVRFNLIDNPYPQNYGMVNIHGSGGGSWTSGRGVEVYNNTIVGAGSMSELMWIRGGGGVIFNNTLENAGYDIGLFNEDGIAGTTVSQLYIWGNTLVNTTYSLLGNSGNYTQNVQYFLRAPDQIDDGFTYTPYPYPHPLTTG